MPLFRKLRLGSILGYLAAGMVIGPFGLGLFSESASVMHVRIGGRKTLLRGREGAEGLRRVTEQVGS